MKKDYTNIENSLKMGHTSWKKIDKVVVVPYTLAFAINLHISHFVKVFKFVIRITKK